MTSIYQSAHEAAVSEAKTAAEAALQRLGGDFDGCGFAWVNCYVDGRTSIAKELKKIDGWRKPYAGGGLQLWGPAYKAGVNVQSITVNEEAARAYAKKMTAETGVDFYAGSRLD